jgi:hypothetical protein
MAAARHDSSGALKNLHGIIDSLPPCHIGWTIPVEPLFADLRRTGALAPVLARLAERAR